MTSLSREPVELRQSAANLLQFPVLIAVVVLAMAVRQLFAHPPSTMILGACAGLAALDIVLAMYLLHNMASTLAVTADDITFTRRRARGKGPPPSRSSSAPPAACSASAWPPMAPPAPSTPATRLSCATMPPARKCTQGRSAAVRSSRPASRKDGRSLDRPTPPCPGGLRSTRPRPASAGAGGFARHHGLSCAGEHLAHGTPSRAHRIMMGTYAHGYLRAQPGRGTARREPAQRPAAGPPESDRRPAPSPDSPGTAGHPRSEPSG